MFVAGDTRRSVGLVLHVIVALVTALSTVTGFQFSRLPEPPTRMSNRPVTNAPKLLFSTTKHPSLMGTPRSIPRYGASYQVSSKLGMVRNIDLPEAIVFYGVESMMEPNDESICQAQTRAGGSISCALRPGLVRLLTECLEVGTAPMLLSEEMDSEGDLQLLFETAFKEASNGDNKALSSLMKSDDPGIHFRCLNSEFTVPATSAEDDAADTDPSSEYDESIEFYNIKANGRSPSPAFLLDSLRSVHIDPRGFGGSSGFGRGQWIEPRRSPMPARTVVFIAGDWTSPDSSQGSYDESERSTVKDRCAAARAAGCRIIYVEEVPGDEAKHSIAIEDDAQAMSLCDAVIDTFGNDNPRDLQPITLDAISTPGDYWLNPPSPRDDVGNAVAVDEIVEWFRSERELDQALGDQECIVPDEDVGGDEMSEEEMSRILADLDGL